MVKKGDIVIRIATGQELDYSNLFKRVIAIVEHENANPWAVCHDGTVIRNQHGTDQLLGVSDFENYRVATESDFDMYSRGYKRHMVLNNLHLTECLNAAYDVVKSQFQNDKDFFI